MNKTARRKMAKGDLLAWATANCLLEHLSSDEAEALTKPALLAEIDGALLRMEIAEDYHAAATDTTARSTEELLGEQPAEPAAKAEPKPNYFDTKPGRNCILSTSCPICGEPAGSRCWSKKGTRTIYIHPARFELWEARGGEIIERGRKLTEAHATQAEAEAAAAAKPARKARRSRKAEAAA